MFSLHVILHQLTLPNLSKRKTKKWLSTFHPRSGLARKADMPMPWANLHSAPLKHFPWASVLQVSVATSRGKSTQFTEFLAIWHSATHVKYFSKATWYLQIIVPRKIDRDMASAKCPFLLFCLATSQKTCHKWAADREMCTETPLHKSAAQYKV